MVTQNHMMMYNHGMKFFSVCVAAALIPISSSTLMDTPWHSWDSPSMQPAETWWTNRQARSWSRPSWIDNSTRPSSSTESPSWRTLMPCLGRYLMMVMWLQINNSANTSACPDMNCLVEWVLDISCLITSSSSRFCCCCFSGELLTSCQHQYLMMVMSSWNGSSAKPLTSRGFHLGESVVQGKCTRSWKPELSTVERGHQMDGWLWCARLYSHPERSLESNSV